MMKKKLLCMLLSITMVFSITDVPVSAEEAAALEPVEAAAEDANLQTEYRTVDEIRTFMEEEKAAKTDKITYETEPMLTAPYSLGALSDDTLDSAAAMIRQIRFIAGLPYDVSLNEAYSLLSQSAALISYVNQEISHTPSQPEDLSEELFDQGCEGAAGSILAYTDTPGQTLNETILDTWMADNDNKDLSALPNRMRILDPSMEQVGFGVVEGEDGLYSAMYTTKDEKNTENSCDIAWPAQNMPVEYFAVDSPWCVLTRESLEESDICVTLTRESDKKEWTFTSDASDGDFHVDNDYSDQQSCIIFAPDSAADPAYADGDSFQVAITKDSHPYINYTVHFFSIYSEDEGLTDPDTDLTEEEVNIKEKDEDSAPAEEEVQYTITFVTDGGTVIPEQSVLENAMIELPEAPVKEGFLFDGWYKDSECTDPWDFTADTVSADMVLYAKWTEERTYTVSFDLQGIGAQLAPVTVINGELLTTPDAPTAEGYVFAEWYKEADCTNAWDFEIDTVTQDTVLYAKWVPEQAAAISTDSPIMTASTRIELTAENTKFSTIKAKTYDGTQYLPTVKFYYKNGTKSVLLTEGVDYSISYRNNINAGTGQVVIRGGGAYTGEVTKNFEIRKKPMSKLKVVTDSLTVGSDPKRNLRLFIYDGSRKLGGNEYTLDYNAETLTAKKTTSAKVVVHAAENSNYSGSVTAKVAVYKLKDSERLLGASNVQFPNRTAVYTGKAITTAVEPTVIYKVSNTETITLEKNKDYKLQYQNNVNAGTGYVIVTGKGQYKGKVVGEFTITALDTAFDIEPIPDKIYSGSLQKPKLSVKAGDKTLKLNKDYIVAYGNNLNVSTETRKAAVTVAGIGNYAKTPRKTVNFEIKPQEITKVSLQGSFTTGLTLIYNKRTLTEGRDYSKPIYDYDSINGNKVAVKITGINNFTGELEKSAKVDVAASKMTPIISSNRNRQNYTSFEGVIMHSYLIKTNKTYMRVEPVSGKGVYAETYSSKFNLRSRKYIQMELPKFGGFYAGTKYYFLVFGQDNPEDKNEVEVMRVVKYDKKWNRKGSVSIYGANTRSPFKNGSLRMTECGDNLYIHTCHQMYNTHQASATFNICISTMEVTEQFTKISETAAYASHSYNQFILTDNSDLLAVNHGDYYPRSVQLVKFSHKADEEKILSKGSHSIAALPIQGNKNAYTGVSVGGFEVSDTAYLITGNSVDQTPETYSSGGVRNIFVTSTPKDNFTQSGTTVHWITNYKDKAEASVTTPQLVKISGSEFMLLWGEGAVVKCVLLNANGEPTTGIYSYDGDNGAAYLSDCKPIAANGKVIWYYTNGSEPIFCSLNPEDVKNQTY